MADDLSGAGPAMLDVALVDAFARHPGEGNRAAVAVVSGTMPSVQLMAGIARFLNEPITVFVQQAAPGESRLAMRWFAPSGELRSCGHGSLAAAHVLLGQGRTATLEFETALGVITARRDGGLIEIDMPAEQITGWTVDPVVSEWLGADIRDAARSARHGLLVVDDPLMVSALRPDLARLAQLPIVGLAVTAPMDGHRYDIVSRWFVPRLGLEDQATGTAHCLLGPYWARRRGSATLRARQASANGADIALTVLADRVLLAGTTVDVGRASVPLSQIPDTTTDRRPW